MIVQVEIADAAISEVIARGELEITWGTFYEMSNGNLVIFADRGGELLRGLDNVPRKSFTRTMLAASMAHYGLFSEADMYSADREVIDNVIQRAAYGEIRYS